MVEVPGSQVQDGKTVCRSSDRYKQPGNTKEKRGIRVQLSSWVGFRARPKNEGEDLEKSWDLRKRGKQPWGCGGRKGGGSRGLKKYCGW